jgi:predicted metal-binding protein
MTNTTNTSTTCQHDNLIVTSGIVRCTDCHEWMHDHEDSSPRPGLIAANQYQ